MSTAPAYILHCVQWRLGSSGLRWDMRRAVRFYFPVRDPVQLGSLLCTCAVPTGKGHGAHRWLGAPGPRSQPPG